MNSTDHDSGRPGDSANVSPQDAEPYRAPASVPDERKRRGLLGSPIAWGIAAVAVLGGLGLALARRSTHKDVINYVEDFGFERRGPVEPIVEEYEAVMSAGEEAVSAETVPQP